MHQGRYFERNHLCRGARELCVFRKLWAQWKLCSKGGAWEVGVNVLYIAAV